MSRLLTLTLLASVAVGCGPPHVKPFNPRNRNYEEGEYAATQEDAKPAPGSIYSEGVAGYLEDTRAVRVGDIVRIRIDEHADAEGDASTDLSKNSSRNLSVDAFFGLVPAIQKAHPDINPADLISFLSDSSFSGEGRTSREGELSGMISVRVKRELPNGDLYIEGTKVVLINREEYHLYVSGLVRTADIAMDNSVESSLIADAQVEFTGRGDVADQTNRGWLSKALDKLNPF